MELVVLRVDELPDGAEARLLEGPDRGSVAYVRVGRADDRLGPGEHDLVDEGPEHLGPEPLTGERLVGDVEIDAGRALSLADQRGVVRIVGNEVRLDEPERLVVEERDVVVGRLTAFDRRHVVRLGLLERLPLDPPTPDVRTLMPLVNERQVFPGQRAEANRHRKGMMAESRSRAHVRDRSRIDGCRLEDPDGDLARPPDSEDALPPLVARGLDRLL